MCPSYMVTREEMHSTMHGTKQLNSSVGRWPRLEIDVEVDGVGLHEIEAVLFEPAKDIAICIVWPTHRVALPAA